MRFLQEQRFCSVIANRDPKNKKMSSKGAIRRMINTASLLLLLMVISPMSSLSLVPTVSIIRPRTAECSSLFMSSEAVTSSSVRSRRGFINNAIGVSFAVMTGISNLSPSFADGDDINQLTDVYFGVGCFWHIQHEFGKHRHEYVYYYL